MSNKISQVSDKLAGWRDWQTQIILRSFLPLNEKFLVLCIISAIGETNHTAGLYLRDLVLMSGLNEDTVNELLKSLLDKKMVWTKEINDRLSYILCLNPNMPQRPDGRIEF